VKKNKSTTVFVGLSGGVDSSVTAALLKKDGYTVVGVFIRTWQPDFIECNFREDRLDAMRVAAKLAIPFLECDAEDVYKKEVADYMIEEYRAGRTPNPDVMCNREIKFGVFWQFAKSHGADYIATGHYAQNENNVLKKANDSSKDQVYFLYRLTSADLAHVLFPIGHLQKTAVRSLAEKFDLVTSKKKDSQGVCMLGDLDLKQFLEHYIPSVRGNVLNETGEVIGYHDGAIFLTLGERHGFTITKKTPADERYYIVAKDITQNTITVSQSSPNENHSTAVINCRIQNCSWVAEIPTESKKYTAQIRYHGAFLPCEIKNVGNNSAEIVFAEKILVAKGQSIVVYENTLCLGGGIVQ
jgi:tRNA-specific 2-thiouridylase